MPVSTTIDFSKTKDVASAPGYFASWNLSPGTISRILSRVSTEVFLWSQVWVFTQLPQSCEIFPFLTKPHCLVLKHKSLPADDSVLFFTSLSCRLATPFTLQFPVPLLFSTDYLWSDPVLKRSHKMCTWSLLLWTDLVEDHSSSRTECVYRCIPRVYMYVLHIYTTYKIPVCILHKKLREQKEKIISWISQPSKASQHT